MCICYVWYCCCILWYKRFEGFSGARNAALRGAWQHYRNNTHILNADPDWYVTVWYAKHPISHVMLSCDMIMWYDMQYSITDKWSSTVMTVHLLYTVAHVVMWLVFCVCHTNRQPDLSTVNKDDLDMSHQSFEFKIWDRYIIIHCSNILYTTY